MNMKKTFKIFGVIIAFVATLKIGMLWSDAIKMHSELGGPRIYSDYKIRNNIAAYLTLPTNAHHLYSSSVGFQDANHFAAFSVPHDEYSTTLNQMLKFIHSSDLPFHWSYEGLLSKAPEHWDKPNLDPIWDVTNYPDIISISTNGITLKYTLYGSRFFVHIWGY